MPLFSCNAPSQATSSTHQLGVGSANGSEALVHALKVIQADPSIPSGSKLCLQLDFSNAFNSINREVMFREVRSSIPYISPWLEYCYST